MYLESSAQTEDTVIGLLGSETLEGVLDGVVLLGEQIIGPVHHSRQPIDSLPAISRPAAFSTLLRSAAISGAPYLSPSCL